MCIALLYINRLIYKNDHASESKDFLPASKSYTYCIKTGQKRKLQKYNQLIISL